ncbi:unnamed protein product [Larinioides sclopetarius]|uniref:Uncharacterized protein n=1 Tax=Larinioides sclopetarius TaxID=280406 RepID=A0AAV1ZLD9_9ARAC
MASRTNITTDLSFIEFFWILEVKNSKNRNNGLKSMKNYQPNCKCFLGSS